MVETRTLQELSLLGERVRNELTTAGFHPHQFVGSEESSDDWRHRGALVVVRRDHVEVWWSVGLRPESQSGPTYAERGMTRVLLDILTHSGIRAELSTPTRQGDVAVWVTP